MFILLMLISCFGNASSDRGGSGVKKLFEVSTLTWSNQETLLFANLGEIAGAIEFIEMVLPSIQEIRKDFLKQNELDNEDEKTRFKNGFDAIADLVTANLMNASNKLLEIDKDKIEMEKTAKISSDISLLLKELRVRLNELLAIFSASDPIKIWDLRIPSNKPFEIENAAFRFRFLSSKCDFIKAILDNEESDVILLSKFITKSDDKKFAGLIKGFVVLFESQFKELFRIEQREEEILNNLEKEGKSFSGQIGLIRGNFKDAVDKLKEIISPIQSEEGFKEYLEKIAQ